MPRRRARGLATSLGPGQPMRTRILAVSALAGLLAITVVLLSGCSRAQPVAATLHDRLSPGITYLADLDGDASPERIFVDRAGGSLTITDGKVVYHSRNKWHVVTASLGDTDHDGLPEVVTLLDDQEGRHIGLFAYFGGKYRERLVTSELTPRPLTFEIVSLNTRVNEGDQTTSAPGGDAILLTLEPAPGQTAKRTVLYRWNGFGFTAVGSD